MDQIQRLHPDGSLFRDQRQGRGIVGRELNLVSLPGVDGAKLKGVRYTERTIEIDTLFIAANDAELRKILEEINYILATDKEEALIFSDEPDRTYYAVFSTAQESEGQNGVYKVTLTFVCPNPEKEAAETVVTTETNSPTVVKTMGKGRLHRLLHAFSSRTHLPMKFSC